MARRLSRATPQVRRLVAGLRVAAACRRFSRSPSAARCARSGPPSTAEPLRLDCGDRPFASQAGSTASTLAGRRAQTCSTWSTTRRAIRSASASRRSRRGLALQLPLYAMAAAEVVLSDRDTVPWQAGYWHVGRRRLRAEAGPENVPPGRAAAWSRSPTGKRCGRASRRRWPDWSAGFAAASSPSWSAERECTGHCPYAAVCRIHQVRSLEKTWQPPRAQD